MNKIFLLCLVILGLSVGSRAHDQSETHTSLDITARNIHVSMELPWAFRRALEQTHSDLDSTSSREMYEDLARDYIKSNFFIEKNGKRIEPSELNMRSGSESHSIHLSFDYSVDAREGFRLTNTLLNDINDDQRNHVELNFPEGVDNLIFDAENTSAKVGYLSSEAEYPPVPIKQDDDQMWNIIVVVVGFLALSAALIILISRRKKNKQRASA